MRALIERYKKYTFLFQELVKRDFKQKYKGTIMGMAWSLLNPLLTLLIMRIVFTRFFGTSIEHYTIFLFCGNLVFSYFNEATSMGMYALLGNASIFSKVNVPKYIFLLSRNVQTLINFGLTMIIFFLFCIVDQVTFTWKFIFLIYPIVCLVIFNIGVGLILSAAFLFFRDIQYLWGVFTQLLMYLSAVFYRVEDFTTSMQQLFLLNPVYCYIKYFRIVVLEGYLPTFQFHLLCAFYAFLSVFIGGMIYKKNNHKFLYYI